MLGESVPVLIHDLAELIALRIPNLAIVLLPVTRSRGT